MKRLTTLLLICALLPGCAEFFVVRNAARGEAAVIADEVRDSSLYMLCKGMTIGAWVREFGQSLDRADAWKVICSKDAPSATAAPVKG